MRSLSVWKRRGLWRRTVLCVYAVGFIGATFNHVTDLVEHGWLPCSRLWGVPAGLNLYWTGLTFPDPLALLVLILHVDWGLVAYGLIMVSDVAINWYAQFVYGKQPLEQSYGLTMQTGFLLFLLLTAPLLLRIAGNGNGYCRGGSKGRRER
jgi:hypothetical protein